MSNNNIARPITMTKGFLVFNFHSQFRQFSFQTLGYFYENKQKIKVIPLSSACDVLSIESRALDRLVCNLDSLFIKCKGFCMP